MTSRREQIVQNIMGVLTDQRRIRIGTVTRDPGIDIEELAVTAMPAVIVQSGGELREDITMGSGGRLATMTVVIEVWISNRSAAADSQRNELLEAIEELLEIDTTRDDHAIDTQLVEIETVTDTSAYSAMRMSFAIRYIYTKGNA